MSRICEKCGRGALKGNTRSHSNISTLRHRQINLQWKKMDGERVKVCTNCIKTSNKATVATK